MYFIYALTDPRTDVVAYVGLTNNPNARLQQHINRFELNDERKAWVEKLQEEGYDPHMKILEVVYSRDEAFEREKYWIQHYKSSGIQITNIIQGKPNMDVLSRAPKGYYTLTEAAEKLNGGSLSQFQCRMLRNIPSKKESIKKMLDMTYGPLMDHVRSGHIRSIVPPGKHQAVYNKEDVDRLSQPEKSYYTAKEAQAILGMTYSALRHQASMGNIYSFIPLEGRQYVYLKKDVDELSRAIEVFGEE